MEKKCTNYYELLTKYLNVNTIEFNGFKRDVMETLRTSEYHQDYKEIFRITGVSDGMELVNGDPYTRNGTCIMGFLVWVVEQDEAFFNDLIKKGVIQSYIERLQDIDNGNRVCRVE